MILAIAGVAAVACQKEQVVEDTLNLDASAITVPNGGAVQSLSFKANGAWVLTCDQGWIEFDKKSGEAGDVTVKMTVQPNKELSPREAKITITVGKKNTVITVSQVESSVFGSSFVYRIDGEAQDIEVSVSSSIAYEVAIADDAKDWLSVVQTKAEQTTGTIKIHASANTGISARRGSFTVTADNYSQSFQVEQEIGYVDVSSVTVAYVGNRNDIFDTETYQFNKFDEYVITLATEEGDALQVSVNIDDAGEDPISSLPNGIFTADASGKHEHKTFSIKPLSGAILYYTKFTSGENESPVYDGEISISGSEGNYSIQTGLVDEQGNPRRYRYNGPVTIADESAGLKVTEPGIQGNYFTHLATDTYQWNFNIYSNTIDEDLEVNLRVANISIFGPEGVAPKGDDLPTGEFTYDKPEADPTYGNNGNVPNKPYTFYVSGSVDRWDEDGNIQSADLDESVKPTLKIEKIAQNVYSVEFTAQFKYSEGHWDEEWNWIIDQEWTIPVAYKTDKVVIPDGTKGNYLWAPEKGVLNVDGSTGLGGYLWYIGGATPYGNAFLLPAVSVGTVSIAMVFANNADDYEYALDASIPTGKYVFSEQPGDRVLIPARYSTSAGSYEAAPKLSSYTKITDSYYGVNYVLTGGTMEILEGNTFVFDVTCQTNTETPEEAKLTGTCTIPFVGTMNRSSWAGRFWFPPVSE